MMRKFKVIIERDPDEGLFTVTVPGLPGCVSQGATKEEALERIKESLEVTLEGFAALGEGTMLRTVEVSLEDVEVAA